MVEQLTTLFPLIPPTIFSTLEQFYFIDRRSTRLLNYQKIVRIMVACGANISFVRVIVVVNTIDSLYRDYKIKA